jgi:hypothetical protein
MRPILLDNKAYCIGKSLHLLNSTIRDLRQAESLCCSSPPNTCALLQVYLARPVFMTARKVGSISNLCVTCSYSLREIGSGNLPFRSFEEFKNALDMVSSGSQIQKQGSVQYTNICIELNHELIMLTIVSVVAYRVAFVEIGMYCLFRFQDIYCCWRLCSFIRITCNVM